MYISKLIMIVGRFEILTAEDSGFFTVSFSITIYHWTCCHPRWFESSVDSYW